MPKISACLVIYNEEARIKKCIDSLIGAVDEIIVVHDGECCDNTLKICRDYNAKIFIRPHAGFMEAHLPFCFDLAQGDWLLRIDADEYLSPELRNNLKILVGDGDVSAYELLWPIWDGKKYLTKQWPRKRCLFKKNKISFLGIPHYVINVEGKIKKCDFTIEHKPDYNSLAWPIFLSKWIAWSKIQAQAYLKNFSCIEKYNYNGNSWSSLIKLRRKIPLLLMPFEFSITLYKNLISGAWEEGRVGFLYSLYCGIYRVMVKNYIFLYKK